MPVSETTKRRKPLKRSLFRAALLVVGTILALGSIAPFINARAFSAPIQRTLEASLGREVHFDAVHFTLFSGPGFSLENVVIGEDRSYGLEPFAFVPTLQARVRVDKLVRGELRFSSFRLVQPSLNLVKRNDGTWNLIDLAERLGTSRRGPLSFFPALEVSDGRIDFKFGTRKTTLYLLDSDLSIYPRRSGKLSVQFSGSPARTDRAGNGFGHVRGTANWFLKSAGSRANQLEADVTLDPSNLSELTTLIEGHDAGVHGTISSTSHIEGPITALRTTGEVRLDDVHRWDLLPSSGDKWRIAYQGEINLAAHRFELETVPLRRNESMPVALRVEANHFLTRPVWSVLAQLDKAPLEVLLPLGRRMGLSLPSDFTTSGVVDGAIGYSNNTGLAGSVTLSNVTATLSNVPPLHAPLLKATLIGDQVHLEPATFETSVGSFKASGDYDLSTRAVAASVEATNFPALALRSTLQSWFDDLPQLTLLQQGSITGTLGYEHTQTEPALWSGEFTFTQATVVPPGIAKPLHEAQGRVTFHADEVDVSHFSALLGKRAISATYRYSGSAKHPEHVRIDVPEADLNEIEAALDPSLNAQGLLARLRVTQRTIPEWLRTRNAEIDFAVHHFSVGAAEIGPLSAHLVWQGTNLQFTSVRAKLAEGLIQAHGSIDIASYTPQCRFTGSASAFPWGGGLLNATGDFETSGTGADTLQNLHATGTFEAEDVTLSSGDSFSKAGGTFEFSFADGWPNLRLSKMQVSDDEDEPWDGEATSQSDGKLVVELQRAGHTRRVVSTLIPQEATAVSLLNKPLEPQ